MRLVGPFAALAALMLAALPVRAGTFTDGEFATFSQQAWGTDPDGANISTVLQIEFDTVFAPRGGFLEVGVPGPSGFSMIFADADAVITYLPTTGTPGPLTVDLLDPVSSASGLFGGEVVALALNVAFSDAGLIAHPSGTAFGDLVFQNLNSLIGDSVFGSFGPEIAELDGLTVREVLSEEDRVLGGSASPFSAGEMYSLALDVDSAFGGGDVGDFAQFLALPSSATLPVPEPSAWPMLLIGVASLAGWRAARQRIAFDAGGK